MKVLVTGAGGFVGGAACAAFRARGDEVRALVSDGAEADVRARLEGAGVAVHTGDVGDEATVARVANGVDVVLHAAAHSRFRGTLAEHERANLIAAEGVLAACKRAQVKRLVFVSTEEVTAGNYKRDYVDESFPHADMFVSPFAQTMALAEDLVLAASGEHGLDTVAVRPGWVWGPGDDEWLPELVRRAGERSLTLYGDGRALVPTTYIDNLVDALVLAATVPAAAGQLYYVTDDERITARAFLGKLLPAVGARAPRRAMPYHLAYALAWLGEHIGVRTSTSRADVVRFGRTALFNVKKAREELGYEPRVRVDEGIRRVTEAQRA